MLFLLFISIGYLLAVLWIDLIFDFPAVPYRNKPGVLPEEVLVLMTGFYRRIAGRPFLIFIIMLVGLAALLDELVRGLVPAWVAGVSLFLFLAPTVNAILRVMPTARRFGSRVDSLEKQTELAHGFMFMHGSSFVMISLLLVVQLFALWGRL